MPYEYQDYTKTPWINVADPSNPGSEAQELSAENLNKIEEGIRSNRDSLHSSVQPLSTNFLLPSDPYDLYPSAFTWMPVTAVDWPVAGTVLTMPSGTDATQLLHGDTLLVRGAVFGTVATWQANTPYALNAFVQPTVPNGYVYRCTAEGTSGATEPLWPTTGSVTDNTVTWTVEGGYWSAWREVVTGGDTSFTGDLSISGSFSAGGGVTATGAIAGGSLSTGGSLGFDGTLSSVPSATQTLIATSVIQPDAYNVAVRADANVTLTSTPSIAAGLDGQEITIVNLGTFTITLNNAVGTTLRVQGGTVTLDANDSIRMTYYASEGAWIQTGALVSAS